MNIRNIRIVRIWLRVAVVSSVLGVAACGSSGNGDSSSGGAAKGPITLAEISLNVPGADYVTPIKLGANAALKAIGANGFGGRKVNIVTCNSMSQPSVADTCAEQTLADHPLAEFGCEPAWGISGLTIYAKHKVPSFNCLQGGQDLTNPYSLGINPGSLGQNAAITRYLCQVPSVKKVVVFTYNLPTNRQTVSGTVSPILKACGKTVDYVYYPTTGGDLGPYVDQALQDHPDFVESTEQGTGAVTMLKLFQQAGFAADKIALPDTAFNSSVISSSGSAIDGVYDEGQFYPWGDTSNSQIAQYVNAVKSLGGNPDDPNVEWGWEYVMYIYAAGKAMGFGNLTSQSLTDFTNSKSGFAIPVSRELVNPGKKGYKQIKQPYVFLSQWENGKFVTVTSHTDNGWVEGLG